MTSGGFTLAAAMALHGAALVATPALGADPLVLGAEIDAMVRAEITPHARWRAGGKPIAFGRTEVRRVGDFAHLRATLTRADGSPIPVEDLPFSEEVARPLTISAVLRLRAGRWLLLDATPERAETIDPDGAFRRWGLPADLLPPDCAHRQNWGCGGTVR